MSRAARRLAGVVLAAAVTAAGLVLPAAPASAAEGLSVAATSTYTVDPQDEVVRARIEIELRNTSPDVRSSDGVYTYYFDAFSLPVPAGAEDVRAESGGGTLAVSLQGTEDPSTSVARIGFPNLLYRQTRTIVLTFDVPGEEPRSEDSTRVGPGYATFVAYGPGDGEDNTVRIVAPTAMTLTSTVDGFRRTGSSGATTTYEADGETAPGEGLWAVVSLRDDREVSETNVEAGDVSLTLEAFPGDERWSEFVGTTVTDGLPVLESLVGTPWPGGLERIREDAAPSIQGYDGWFDPSGDEIVIGEQLDADLIYHELSHAWLSGERFDQRWLFEGLAQVVAERTLEATDGTPTTHPNVSRGSDLAVPLNAWGGSAGARSEQVDQYAYPASYRVMTQMLGDLDDERFAAVLGAAIDGERAYDPPGVVDPGAGRTSWQDWLDLVETRGGVGDADDVYARWVLTDEQAALLAPRADERRAYAEIDAADGDWLPPESLRTAMTEWAFDRARSVRTEVEPLAAMAGSLQQTSTSVGLAVPETVRSAYEDARYAEDYASLASALPATADALVDVGAARDVAGEDQDPFTALGGRLLGVQDGARSAVTLLEAGEIAPAAAAADTVRERADWRLPLGLGLSLGALLVLLGAGWVVLVAVRRRDGAPVLERPAGADPSSEGAATGHPRSPGELGSRDEPGGTDESGGDDATPDDATPDRSGQVVGAPSRPAEHP